MTMEKCENEHRLNEMYNFNLFEIMRLLLETQRSETGHATRIRSEALAHLLDSNVHNDISQGKHR